MPPERIAVLVVEDEDLIRISLVGDLEDAGFVVFEASSADEALIVLENHPETSAVFTDIDMPGTMDGLTLSSVVRQSRPDIPIILTSGYLRVPKNELPRGARFFSKPYDTRRVVNHIRDLTGC